MAIKKVVKCGADAYNFMDITTMFTVAKGEEKEVGPEIYGSKIFQEAVTSGHITLVDSAPGDTATETQNPAAPAVVPAAPVEETVVAPKKGKGGKKAPVENPEVVKIQSLDSDGLLAYLDENFETDEAVIKSFMDLGTDEAKKEYLIGAL
jgi:hypothetical protein